MQGLGKIKSSLILLLIFCLVQLNSRAQSGRGNDTAYYQFFPGSITGRLFTSQKYTAFSLNSKEVKDIHYIPNSSFNFGVGATYHNLSLNLAYGFGLNKKLNDTRGKTTYLDLQAHFYTPKWVNDLYVQLYKGYYLYPQGYATTNGQNYYHRPDIKVNLFGLSRYRIFNPNRFSYRAAFLQNEWQKKSAGTLLLGAEAYYGTVRADSSLVPAMIENNFTQAGINQINYLSIGPGVGYAYTLVVLQHFFITGSLTGNLNFSYTTEHAVNNKTDHFSVNPATTFRIAAGYNGRVWNISGNWVSNNLPFKGNETENKYMFNTGNYRFIIAKRFMPGKKLQRRLSKIDRIIKE